MPRIRKASGAQAQREAVRLLETTLKTQASWDTHILLESLDTTPRGLTSEAAEARLDDEGKNRITVGHKSTALTRFFEALINPFNIVLLVIAIITFFTDVVLPERKDYVTVAIIVALVLLSTMVAFIQNQRSNAAAETLSHMIENHVDVWRDEALTEIALEDLVRGDVIRLSAGDMIPGDVRFLTTKDTFVAQAALTGESNPVEKFASGGHSDDSVLMDLPSLGFVGSNIVSGSATAVVLATGNHTYFGSMAKSLSGDRAKNSFERGVDSVSSLLIRLMLVMVPIVFVINGITKQDWISSLLFAVTVAVGLTPEMLPVIMASTLAKGAVTMSTHKVIVKALGSIQVFGEMDVLCTDKTGTLTEDKIVLEKYMNIGGDDDPRILRHAYLNSAFQTGLKNLIDLAIINRAVENGLAPLLSSYTRVDEIPFDFQRRRMSVVLVDQRGKRQLITKGAVEEIMACCRYIEEDGQVLPLDDAAWTRAQATYDRYNAEGLRMLAVAQKNNVSDEKTLGVADESDMVLIGFVGFLDPPKESAGAAIAALKAHGVRVVVLTGDSEGVAIKVCGKVGVNASQCLSGRDVELMDDAALSSAVKTCDLFAKLSPTQKSRVVSALQEKGHTVGYMGDGINDAPALRQADVGISVDSAVDIAKETAEIILLEKDLMVLKEGVVGGRRTFGNIMKYIKMAASGNFGNMVSVTLASIFLPFLPMLPVQILTQNLLCDFSQMGIPFDKVDDDYVTKPRRWETASLKRFMWTMGPLSSLFDILCYAVMWWIIKANTQDLSPLFQCGWFAFGTLSQVFVIHMIRTGKVPIIKSNASPGLYLSTGIVSLVVVAAAFTMFADGLMMMPLPLSFVPWLALLLLGYCAAVQLCKHYYMKWFGEWL